MFRHNVGPVGVYHEEVVKPFFIDVVFRTNADMLLETVNWKTEFLNADGSDDQFKTLTHISIWNSHQHSGRIALNHNQPLLVNQIRRTLGEWTFNDFRNILTVKGQQFLDSLTDDFALLSGVSNTDAAWYNKELMNDNWFCVRFEFDNTEDKQVILHDVSVQAQTSMR